MQQVSWTVVTIAALLWTIDARAVADEAPAGFGNRQATAKEAPAGSGNRTNGLVSQPVFDADQIIFEEVEGVEDGLGPVFNDTSCGACHNLPITEGAGTVTELRAGHRNQRGIFVEAPGGSVIQQKAVDPKIQERLSPRENIRALRASLNILGDGFVEAIPDSTLRDIAALQARASGGTIKGEVVLVPVLEAGGALQVGRFGWKNQHASLVSFAADAYLNEMGITTPFLPTENTSLGRPVDDFDDVADPEDDGEDVALFAEFMRATTVPPRDTVLSATPDAQAGSLLFARTGCVLCHISAIITAPPGTPINGGTFVVPPALGNKVIHPFSDFLLHDVGTGDGIVQNGGQGTANKLRTTPLWGLRTRTQFMHDGQSRSLMDAILRHNGEARFVIREFRNLSNREQQKVVVFLRSL